MTEKFSKWPIFSREEIKAAKNTLQSGKVNYWTGKQGKFFEEKFAQYCNVKYAIAVSNGTVALDLALIALEIKKGDEIIVTPRTYVSTVLCIINIGAKPIFADVDDNSGNITSNSIKECISKKTKAIICVHIGGFPCEMDPIVRLSKKNKVPLIEDCSQVHGGKYKNKSLGSFGDIGTWSFCQDKIISTGGEGGMITTNKKKLWKKMWSYKDHGKNFNKVYKKNNSIGFKWLHDFNGSNYRMTEFQATIGIIQLKKLNNWNLKRNNNSKKIINICEKFSQSLRVTNVPKHINHAWYRCYVYVIQSGLKPKWNRNRIMFEINKLSIPCQVGTCPEVYKERIFKKNNIQPKKKLKNIEELSKSSLAFFVHPNLTIKEINKTCKAINSVMMRASIQ